MIETHQIAARGIEAVGAKRLSSALSLSLSHTYRLARHPMDVENPDATGGPNFFDKFEAFGDLMAAHPAQGMSVLVQLRIWTDEKFERWFRHGAQSPLLDVELAARAGQACKEFGEFVASLQPGFDPDTVAKEAADVIAILEIIVKAAEKRDDIPKLRAAQ